MSYAKARETLVEIGLDTVKTVALLAALTLVHAALDYTNASEDFKSLFTRIHESILLLTYILLATKSILRMVRL
jgi:hypothetical protein